MKERENLHDILRESPFNMTREDEDIEGGLWKFLDTRKGGSEKIRRGSENLYTLNPKGGGERLLKNWTASEGSC